MIFVARIFNLKGKGNISGVVNFWVSVAYNERTIFCVCLRIKSIEFQKGEERNA